MPGLDDFGKRLAALRKQRGWTLQKLEEQSGLRQGQLSNLENKVRKRVEAKTLVRLAHAFRVSTDYLLSLRTTPGAHQCSGDCPAPSDK